MTCIYLIQCVGRALRGKTDYGIMIFADKVVICSPLCHMSHDLITTLVTAITVVAFNPCMWYHNIMLCEGIYNCSGIFPVHLLVTL